MEQNEQERPPILYMRTAFLDIIDDLPDAEWTPIMRGYTNLSSG